MVLLGALYSQKRDKNSQVEYNRSRYGLRL